jgi:hypothetical protein
MRTKARTPRQAGPRCGSRRTGCGRVCAGHGRRGKHADEGARAAREGAQAAGCGGRVHPKRRSLRKRLRTLRVAGEAYGRTCARWSRVCAGQRRPGKRTAEGAHAGSCGAYTTSDGRSVQPKVRTLRHAARTLPATCVTYARWAQRADAARNVRRVASALHRVVQRTADRRASHDPAFALARRVSTGAPLPPCCATTLAEDRSQLRHPTGPRSLTGRFT